MNFKNGSGYQERERIEGTGTNGRIADSLDGLTGNGNQNAGNGSRIKNGSELRERERAREKERERLSGTERAERKERAPGCPDA